MKPVEANQFKMPDDMAEFLLDHPMAQAVVFRDIRRMMRNSATTGDDPKQVAKLCKECDGFDGEHADGGRRGVPRCSKHKSR